MFPCVMCDTMLDRAFDMCEECQMNERAEVNMERAVRANEMLNEGMCQTCITRVLDNDYRAHVCTSNGCCHIDMDDIHDLAIWEDEQFHGGPTYTEDEVQFLAGDPQ